MHRSNHANKIVTKKLLYHSVTPPMLLVMERKMPIANVCHKWKVSQLLLKKILLNVQTIYILTELKFLQIRWQMKQLESFKQAEAYESINTDKYHKHI